jgi:prepilin-type N-terminal cleavage/methylation domain-containing protein
MIRVSQNNYGFTIVELIITMGIFAIITSFVTINLLSAQHSATINTTTTTLIADLKQQQTKAMVGDTEGRSSTDQYGIHFDTDKYVLFHGTYNEGDSTNFEVKLEGSLSFTNITGLGNIIFSKGSGESYGLSSIVLSDSTTNRQKTITINVYGVISNVD